MKEKLYQLIQDQSQQLLDMADRIFDNPEYDGEEVFASGLLEDYLEDNGFQVERGLTGWPTAFRAVWKQGEGGPRIGLLCEYDALRQLGHGCGHHMQGPCICGTAVALKNAGFEKPFELVVYGTPAEETRGAKITMWENGCFRDIDVALIHVQKAAPDGTCRIEGAVFNDLDMALGSRRVIVSCEEIVTNEEIRREPGLNQISCIIPDAIVLAPYGAHPSQVCNYYDYDRAYLKYYDRVGREDGLFEEYLDEWVRGPADHYAYLEKLGVKRLMDLRVRPGMNIAIPAETGGTRV